MGLEFDKVDLDLIYLVNWAIRMLCVAFLDLSKSLSIVRLSLGSFDFFSISAIISACRLGCAVPPLVNMRLSLGVKKELKDLSTFN